MYSGHLMTNIAAGLLLLALGPVALPPAMAQGDKKPVTINPVPERLPGFSYASVPFSNLPEPWKRLRLVSRQPGQTVLELDRNSFRGNGYSQNWASTRMMPQRIPVTLHSVQGLPLRKKGVAKVYQLRAKALPKLLANLRLVVGVAGQPLRLLVGDDKAQVRRVISLENEGPNRTPLLGVVENAFSLESVFLGADVSGARQVSIQGSLLSGKAKLILDRNAKTLDAYGDPGISTLMMPIPIEVKLAEKTDIGDAQQTVRVFDLDGLPPALMQKFRLVTAKTTGGSNRLLLLNGAGNLTGVIPLEVSHGPNPLINTTWRLEEIGYNSGKTIKPQADRVFQISFQPGGRLVGKAEVNRLIGTYVVADTALTLSPIATTRAAYPPDSIAPEFLKALGNAAAYLVKDKKLILLLKYDSGSVIFAPEQ